MSLPLVTELSADSQVLLYELTTSDGQSIHFSPFIGAVMDGISYVPISCTLSDLNFELDNNGRSITLNIEDLDNEFTRLYLNGFRFVGGRLRAFLTKKIFFDNGDFPSPLFKSKILDLIVTEIKEIKLKELFVFRLDTLLQYEADNNIGQLLVFNRCTNKYRDAYCAYSGVGVTLDRKPAISADDDQCGLTLADCRHRSNQENFRGILSRIN